MTIEFFAEPIGAPGLPEKLAKHAPENPFCTPGFLKSMQTWGADLWVAGLKEGHEWLSAGGVFFRRGRLNAVAEIVSLPAAANHEEYWAGLRGFCSQHGITQLECESYGSPPLKFPLLSNEVSRSIRCEHVLDLEVPDLSSRMSKKHLQRFRKAKASGLTLRRTGDENAYLEHVRVVDASLNRRRQRGERIGCEAGADIRLLYLRNGCGELFQAMLEETVLSSALVLLSPDGAYYQSSGSTPEGMAHGASDFLVHSVAEGLRDQGVKIFNLGGASPGSSLEDFKKRFGGSVVQSTAVKLDIGPNWRKILTRAVKVARTGRPTFAILRRFL